VLVFEIGCFGKWIDVWQMEEMVLKLALKESKNCLKQEILWI